MREVLTYIRKRTEEQHNHPFIKWLDDDSVPAREWLTRWFPNNAGFAMGFKNLNLMILRYPDEEARRTSSSGPSTTTVRRDETFVTEKS